MTHPRLMSEARAAEAVGIPLNTFREWVRIGKLPSPLPGVGMFDMRKVHLWIDRISGIGDKETAAENALDEWAERRNARKVKGSPQSKVQAGHG
jgi:hypothetical protein